MACLGDHGVKLIGAVPAGLPIPRLPSISAADLTALLLPALGVALVGYTDAVLTGRAFATRRHERVDADTELLALGAANLAFAQWCGRWAQARSRRPSSDSIPNRIRCWSLCGAQGRSGNVRANPLASSGSTTDR